MLGNIPHLTVINATALHKYRSTLSMLQHFIDVAALYQYLLTASIPLHGIAIAATLVVFKSIGEGGSIATEGEVVACVRREHHRARHVEAVEVASERRCGHRYLMILEVIS